MSGLKTLLVVLNVLPMPVWALENVLASAFASCAGRLSAELEHAWLMNNDQVDEIARRRGQFIDLLSATISPDQHRDAVNLRVQAKFAHAALLTQATFSEDRERADWAVDRAESEIAYCSGLLLKT